MITEDYVSFETAKLLKEKGFDEGVLFTINKEGFQQYPKNLEFEYLHNSEVPADEYSAPTLQMAMKWLREKYLVICIIPLTFYCGEKVGWWGYSIWAGDNLEVDEENAPKFTTYEEACETAIKYCLEKLI